MAPSVWTGRALQAEKCDGGIGLAFLYPALEWSFLPLAISPGHHGYPRASDLILGKALRGRLCHQITGATARPFLHFLHPTRRLGGYFLPRQLCGGRRQPPASNDSGHCARFVAAALRQDRPGDPRQLVGERGCQNIVMQPLSCGCEPRSKAVFCPICRSKQNNASALHEQRAQIAIAALCNAAEDRPISRRHLLRHEAEPGGKVAPLGKGRPIANCRYHRAGDNRSAARNGHQLPTGLTVVGQKFDLLARIRRAFCSLQFSLARAAAQQSRSCPVRSQDASRTLAAIRRRVGSGCSETAVSSSRSVRRRP
jgi:hypothetical protein